MGDGPYCNVRDPKEIARLKSVGVMDSAFMTASEYAAHEAAHTAVWVQVEGSYWTYTDWPNCVRAKLYYQSYTDCMHPMIGWVLEGSFYRRDNISDGKHYAVYQSAAEALAAFARGLAAHFQGRLEREEASRRYLANREAENRRLGDEVRSALGCRAPAAHGAVITPEVRQPVAAATPEVRQSAHLGRGLKNLLD